MADHYQNESEIEAVVSGFESCITAAADFTHVDHLTVAAVYLHRSSFEEAMRKMRAGLFRFIEHYGVVGKYHETLTVFWMKVVQVRLADLAPDCSLLEATNTVIEALSDSRLVFEYYSGDRLWSDEARQVWLKPDLKEV